jgi:hypothetical protein
MKSKKQGKKPGKSHKPGKDAGHSMMEVMEKSMHGSNRGAGFKGYKGSKGGM